MHVQLPTECTTCEFVLITTFANLSYQVFVAASIASLICFGYFYPFCLLHIVVNNDILQRVLRSVTKNGEHMLMNFTSVILL